MTAIAADRLTASAFPVLGVGLLVLAIGVDAMLGQTGMDARTVLAALTSAGDNPEHVMLLHMRFPRIAAALLAGAAFGVSGALLQAATRNPLASPGILGINSGAFLALTASVLLLPDGGPSPMAASFVGGVCTAGLVYAVAGGTASPLRLTLAGVAVSLALGSAASAIVLLHDENIAGLYVWGAGTLDQIGWDGVRYAAPYIFAGLLVAVALARTADVLALGQSVAIGLGQQVDISRLGAAATATLLAAAAVCIVGPIGFIGLVAPNLLRLAGCHRHRLLLPGSALWGALLLLLADIGAQLASMGNFQVPAGVVAAVIGAPVLVMLIRRTRDPQRPSGAFQNQAGSARASFPPIAAGGSIILILAVAAGTALGDRILWPEEIWHGLTGGGSVDASFLVDLRLPRMLVAVAAGALLGLSGLLFQAMVRNPLASPELLGVSQGAGLAALMVMLIVPVAPFALIQTAAIGGGLAVLAVVVAVARRAGLAPARLALAGIATAAFCAALSNLVVIGSGLQGAQALVWLSGSTYARGWDELIVLLPWLVLGTLMVWATPRILDVLALGDDVSAALGVAPGRTRVALLVCATALAGAAVSVVGTVAFVGLIAPHAARLLVGTRNGRLLVITPILGGLIMATADIAGRLVAAPREVPVGLMAALLGAPYFLALLWRLRR